MEHKQNWDYLQEIDRKWNILEMNQNFLQTFLPAETKNWNVKNVTCWRQPTLTHGGPTNHKSTKSSKIRVKMKPSGRVPGERCRNSQINEIILSGLRWSLDTSESEDSQLINWQSLDIGSFLPFLMDKHRSWSIFIVSKYILLHLSVFFIDCQL